VQLAVMPPTAAPHSSHVVYNGSPPPSIEDDAAPQDVREGHTHGSLMGTHKAWQLSSPKMLFSDLYKLPKSPLSKLRRNSHPEAVPRENGSSLESDLLSKDKTKQKEAVKKFLAERIRSDWVFQWPLPGQPRKANDTASPAAALTHGANGSAKTECTGAALSQDLEVTAETESPVTGEVLNDSGAEADSDTDSQYSTVSEDTLHWRPRAEWASDLSDDDAVAMSPSPFRFDSPDSVGTTVQASANAKKAKRRRAIRSEMEWNTGLACFNARRDAWTGARTVHVKAKVKAPGSPMSPRRGLWRWHSHTRSLSESTPSSMSPIQADSGVASMPMTPLSPVASIGAELATPLTCGEDSQKSSQHGQGQHEGCHVEIMLPLAPPLLPPANPMRASITPHLYLSLYDKVVTHSLQPSCPINLADMVRSCVAGWKRDGEWPPKPTEVTPVAVVAVRKKKRDERRESFKERRDSGARRMSLAGLLGRGNSEEHKDILKKDGASAEAAPAAEGDDGAKGIKRSIQKVFGLGHGHGGGGHAHSASVGSGMGKEIAGQG